MRSRQFGLDDFSGRDRGNQCQFLKRTPFSGVRDPQGDVVCMGSCSMKGGTVYSRDCETCTMWRMKE